METSFKEHSQVIVEEKENTITKMEIIMKVVGQMILKKVMEG